MSLARWKSEDAEPSASLEGSSNLEEETCNSKFFGFLRSRFVDEVCCSCNWNFWIKNEKFILKGSFSTTVKLFSCAFVVTD